MKVTPPEIVSNEKLYIISGHQGYKRNCDFTADVVVEEKPTTILSLTTELSFWGDDAGSDSNSLNTDLRLIYFILNMICRYF